jgi:hypothetical protein
MNRVKGAFAELGIVMLGVMIALAADSWREELAEDQVEFEYLGRLQSDLSAGVAILRGKREEYQAVKSAAWSVIKALESESGHPNNDVLVWKLIEAAAMGFDRHELASDVTYRELVTSGQLNLLTDYEVRESIVAYYRQVDRLADGLEELPELNFTIGSLTGYLPVDFLLFGVELAANDQSRLLRAARDDPQLTMQLRLLHAQLVFNDREFEGLGEQAQRALSLIEGVTAD